MYKLLFNRMLTITNLFVIYILYFTPNNYLHKNLLLSLGGVVVFRYVVAGNVSGKSWGQVTSHPPITVLTVDQKINKYRQEKQIWRTSKIKSTCTHQIISSNITRFGLLYLPVIAKLARLKFAKGRYRQAWLDLVEVHIPGLLHFHPVSFFERQIIFVDGIKVI